MIDFTSSTWRSLVDHLHTELAILRGKNDNPKLTQEETSAIRGRIAQINDLLSLPRLMETKARMPGPSQEDY
ncbi:hypothetical protein [Polynucleobacter asymbioticus]|jgi:hypothetical protein|uniref:Uncharacterized protein n=1 Tax=Polynucleobacter asymbioticus TaxID=576611 RepID=A0AAC9NGE5_9BURK|nr:hypothetical protein [Polynucleobacter asymbioticus]APB99028.1 hypothetical protein A4F89_06650 [Polynucleobacter asymbioticus]APC01330.1 hypothetical protein AOC25_06750 [Polynucleobacter asymbioticus]